ncbi:MAG: Isoprenyl transferase [Microgenomates group bacterium GW2011_GWA2_39_19]|nr:MAG: Isoprenyl transferase [Microgenomates group bacterium GW2011_GWA2_39_19]
MTKYDKILSLALEKMSNNDNNLPQHVAIIMDGNRRWAAKRGLGPVDGHKQAAEKTISPIVRRAIKRGIKYLTLWAFSTENQKRDKEELDGLFSIFKDALASNLKELEKLGVQIKIIGDINWFPGDIPTLARGFVERTKNNSKITVSFALNYGGREEILRAVSRLLDKVQTHQRSAEEPITEAEFSNLLDTAGMPDPDMVIRTGGNIRLSGYFPWQSVYAELYFVKTLWPDFTPGEFDKALLNFMKRTRRFGGGSFKDYLKGKIARRILAR